jgi:transposase
MGTLRRVTDAQVKALRQLLNQGVSLQLAAMKTDMDRKSARKYQAGNPLPSEARQPHSWRTRVDPVAEVWAEVAAFLENEPTLMAKTLWDWLQHAYPGRYPSSVRRTLERRVRQWKAQHGPSKEVFFAQEHLPGRLAASDFTWMNGVQVTIQGVVFDHMVYHFVLTYSNWEHVTVCFSESFASLSNGLQNALWALGGVPQRHRTDRMTLAVHHDGNAEEFTANYQALMAHYGVTPEATNPARSHENGDAESAHGHFKKAVAQALLLRGSRDFASRVAYQEWLSGLLQARNAGRASKVAIELASMRALPAKRLETLERTRVRVSRLSTIRVKNNTYSVPARLIGEQVEVRIGLEEIEVWYAQQAVLRLERLRGQDKHRVDYRHVIDWLVRKPGAFARYVYRDDLYPTLTFRRAYDALLAAEPTRADKEYVHLLHLVSREGEQAVGKVLEELLQSRQPISVLAVEARLGKPAPSARAALVEVAAVDLRQYDGLLCKSGDDKDSSLTPEDKEVVDGPRTGTGPGEVLAGIMSVGAAEPVRGGGPSGGSGDLELPAVSAGAGAAGMPAASPEANPALAEGIEAAAGEELANAGPEAFAAEGCAAVAGPVEWRLPGPTRECAAVWPAGHGQDACPVRGVAGIGAFGSACFVHQGWLAGAGVVGGQAGPASDGSAEALVPVGRGTDRRPRLCAAKPGGDGGVVHALGRAVRARQRAGDQQSAVLEVGTDLQGSHDSRRGHRPIGAPQRDRGDECGQLPDGERQDEEGYARVGLLTGVWQTWLTWHRGSRGAGDVGSWLRSGSLGCASAPSAAPGPHITWNGKYWVGKDNCR